MRPDEWNKSARQYYAFEKTWHFYGTVADAIISRLPIKESSRILELACGTGACTLKLAKIASSGEVVALDFSEGMLSAARENAAEAAVSNIVFVQGEASKASTILAGQKFDFAVCNSAFWHFELERVLMGLRNLLTESGVFALSLPSWASGNPQNREAFRAKLREVLSKHGVPPTEIDRLAAAKFRERTDFPALFDRCGFVTKETTFEFGVTLQSRAERRQISAFSGSRRWVWALSGLDPVLQEEARNELEEWRKVNRSNDPRVSKWRIILAYPSRAEISRVTSSQRAFPPDQSIEK